ncbi:Zinc finger RING-type [Gracilaria domingensis]|nr:Zinc finger RING-type [Gracilaria domingensis]
MQFPSPLVIQFPSIRQDNDRSSQQTTSDTVRPKFYLLAFCVAAVLFALFNIFRRRRLFSRNRSARVSRLFQHSRVHRPPPPVYRPYSAGHPRTTIFVPVINHFRDQAARDRFNAEFAEAFGSSFSHDLHLPQSAEPPKEVYLRSFQAKEEDKHFPCPICLDALETEPVSAGRCNHMMHTSCLRGWLAKDPNAACPICRAPYDDFASAPTYSSRVVL